MLKKHKNSFLKTIEKSGLDPGNFEVGEDEFNDLPGFFINFRNTPLRFIARNSSDSYFEFDYKCTKLAPGFPELEYHPKEWPDEPLGIYGDGSGWADIDTINSVFELWLKSVVIEYLNEKLEPDLWAQLKLQESVVSSDILDNEDISFFAEEEKAQLRIYIDEFRLKIVSDFNPSENELKMIEERLKYLADALERLPRFDWKSLLLNTLLSISIALSLDSEKGKMLYNLFKQVFTKIVYLLR